MGANSSIRAHNEHFLTRISTSETLYSDKSFWKTLFETLSPYLEIPDLSQITLNQKQNVIHVCQLSVEFLETSWLQVEELSPGLIRSSENALNFLSYIIPVTIEHSLLEFFWDQNMRAYRALKAAIGLYTSLFFGASGAQVGTIQQFNTGSPFENSHICNKRREMVLKLLLACLASKNLAYKWILSRDIFVNEEFFVALLQSLMSLSVDLTFSVCKCLSLLLSNDSETDQQTEDVLFTKDLLKQRKKLSLNTVQQFFSHLSDENINKVLNSIVVASATLQGSEKIEVIIEVLAVLFSLNENYCKYTAVNKNFAVVSAILTSRENLSIRLATPNAAKVFYPLSLYREFSVSLSVVEVNQLLEFIFKIVLAGDYEFQDHFPYLLGTFCNISAFILHLSQTNSHLVTLIIEYLTDKVWLLSQKNNYLNIFYTIQAINNLIQYQWEGCPFLIYHIVKKKESFYKIIRMQVDTPDEECLDDKATDGEVEEESFPSENSDEAEEVKNESENSSEEVYSERKDRVVELERISEGLILGLNASGPDEVVQRTSYLNTHISTFEEEVERRNTVQNLEVKEENWKPTPEWMLVWKSRLPMKCVFVVIKEIFSLVVDLQEKVKKVEEIVEKIRNVTLVGVLPRPHPIYYVMNLR